MMRILTLLSLCFVSTLMAIDVTTTQTDVSHEQNDQQLGIFTLEFSANEFPNASPTNPTYVSFSLSQSPRFSRSVVDLRDGANEFVNVALNIAVYGTFVNTDLPRDAVQLVRLIEGERTGWLRINYPTSQWIRRGGIVGPPTSDARVAITLGLSGTNSVRPVANTNSGGNETAGTFVGVASTYLIADYRNTPDFGIDDLERLLFNAYGSDTSGVETGDFVIAGSNAGAAFSDDGIVGVGTANVPCLDLHFDPNEVTDSQPHAVNLNQLNLIDHNTYAFEVPTVYLSNTSDFPWLTGTRLYLHFPEYDVQWHNPGLFRPPTNITSSEEFDFQDVTPTLGGTTSNADWSIVPMYWGNRIAGYEFILQSGTMQPFERLDINGLFLQIDTDYHRDTLLLAGSAWYTNTQVFPEEDFYLLNTAAQRAVVLSESDIALERQIIPYTAYNRSDLDFFTHLANPNATPVPFGAFLYNRHGVLLRMYSGRSLPAYGKDFFNIGEEFGNDADSVLAWVEILSEHPIISMGEVRGQDGQTLDFFSAQNPDSHELFAPHLPSATEVWKTHAYVVSTDTEVDTDINLRLPQSGETRVNNVFLPGGTSILEDQDFFDGSGRAPWFAVNLPFSPAAGVLFYERIDNSRQIVSVPLSADKQTRWDFPHVANVEAGWWNGLVLFNPSGSQIEAVITAYDISGETVTTRAIQLPPESKYVDLLEAMLFTDRMQDVSRLKVQATSPIMSFLLVGFEAAPVLTRVPAAPAVSNQYMFPYVGEGNEWTGIALVNPNAQSQTIQLTPYYADGTPGAPVSWDLPANGKVVRLLNDDIANLADYASFRVEASGLFQAMGLVGTFDGRYLATLEAHPAP